MTRAGAFRHRVTVKRPSANRTKDAGGREVPDYDIVAEDVPARINELAGRSAFIAAQRQSEATHEVGLRYMPALADIEGSWIVEFGTRVFVQDAPARNPGERNRELILTCTEGVRTQ